MKKYSLFFLLLFFSAPSLFAQDSLKARIILVGDAGELTGGKQPVIDAVKKTFTFDQKTTIIFLGDNLYKKGMPDSFIKNFDAAKAALDAQLEIDPGNKAKIYLIPGNHDWAKGSGNGVDAILRAQSYIDRLGNGNVQMLPRDACPGPEMVNINNEMMLVFMDSQWWLQEGNKPGVESDCSCKTRDEVLSRLEEILAKNPHKLVLLATHHPFKSYGVHGGYYTIKQHIFPFTDIKPWLFIPLPVLGSAYPIARGGFGALQDIKHPAYRSMIAAIDTIALRHKNLIHVSGHDHNLQLIKENGGTYIVSGSGVHSNRVHKGRNSLYASAENGFAALEISSNNNVKVDFYTVNADQVKKTFSNDILQFSGLDISVAGQAKVYDFAANDSVRAAVSNKYTKINFFKKLFLGKNYRKEWNEPVQFKTFNIKTEQGGFTIKSLGGGKQTKSLKLIDSKGREWSLRTIDKDPEKAIPDNLKGTVAQEIVQDMISASHPYSPLAVPALANAAGVIHAEPQFFYVPEDPALGTYMRLFANQVCLLECNDITIDGTDSKSTSKVIEKMLEDNDHHIDQEKLLNARLLDMYIGDWDRHADQWKWGKSDTGKGKLYYPIPRDRDQAFWNSRGLLIKILARDMMPFLNGFDSKIKNINGLNFVARDFDRMFLNNLDKAAWKRIAGNFNRNLTDEVISKAAQSFPSEIAPYNSAKVAAKLQGRRDDLDKQWGKYYHFLSKRVTVAGSNDQEYFHISDHTDGLQVAVYKKNKRSDSASLMYKRVFQFADTKEIRLYGLEGNDKFEIDQNVHSKIKLRIIGGKGEDTFHLKGNIRNHLYDRSTEKNDLQSLRRTKKRFSEDGSANAYKPTGFQYNRFVFPLFNMAFNTEDKFLVGIGFSARRFGFRKEPYASNHKFSSLYAPDSRAYKLRYEAEFNSIFLKNDLVFKADFVNPTLNNFFGFGNSSGYNKNRPIEYYRVRYKYLQADLLMRKRFNETIQLSFGPAFYQYWSEYEDNKGRILGDPFISTADSLNIYTKKNFFGGKVKLDIVNINNEVFPTRGIAWITDYTSLWGTNIRSRDLSRISSDMTIYTSLKERSRLVSVIRVGGAHIFSKNVDYFQALNLGMNNYLRGFRKNRFTGTSAVYGSSELRLKLFTTSSFLLPGDFGLLGFFDIGRVWNRNEDSNKWHNSYGGGIYIVPYNMITLSAAMGFSKEDKMFNFTIGTKFNLNY